MMKFNTFSVVVGDGSCNARCDFCVAKMTDQFNLSCRGIDNRVFDIACRLAEKSDVTTALLTGKGEPTLFHEEISCYLKILNKYFPIIELQTNGLLFLKNKEEWVRRLTSWKSLGLTTVALSIVHYEDNMNKRIYCDDGSRYRFNYPNLIDTINFITDLGLSVRLNCIGIDGYIDSVNEINALLSFANVGCKKKMQVTWRPVQMPEHSRDDKVATRTRELEISDTRVYEISRYFAEIGTVLHKLPHGAIVYDVYGQNFCLSNCLTIATDPEEVRQIIYVDGRIIYDWQYEGAIIL